MEGAEGVNIDARSMYLEAGQAISMTSHAGHIVLDGDIILDPLALPGMIASHFFLVLIVRLALIFLRVSFVI